MNTLHMHSTSRGMNKAALSQHAASRTTENDMAGSKSKGRKPEREARAELLPLHYKQELWKRHRVPNLHRTGAHNSSLEGPRRTFGITVMGGR